PALLAEPMSARTVTRATAASASVDDVDEHVPPLAGCGRFHDSSQRVCGAPAAADDPAVVLCRDTQLEDDRFVLLLDLLDGDLVGQRHETLGEVLKQQLRTLAGAPGAGRSPIAHPRGRGS